MATKAGIVYQMQWLTVENNSMEVDIYDNSVQIDSSLTAQTYQLSPAGSPCTISITDNDENKLTPIRAKKAVLRFLNDDTFNFSTFATGEDGRFLVQVLCDASTIFTGWLQQGDIYEPFLYQKDQEVELTAIDGLSFLKGVPLTDFSGNVPRDENRLMDYIAWALGKTDLFLNIFVVNNLRDSERPNAWQTIATFTATNKITVPMPGYSQTKQSKFFRVGATVNISGSASNNGNKVIATVNDTTGEITITGSVTNEASGPMITFTDVTSNGNIYDVLYVDAKTFEDKPGTTIDCYTALERILGQSCFITQYQGNWWIFRVKEMRNDFVQYVVEYSNTGTIVTTFTQNLEKAIGLKDVTGTAFPGTPDAIAFFSKEATKRTISRPVLSYELDFNFEPPREIPCNNDFSRGADLGGTFADEVIDSITYNVKHFNLDDWTICKGFSGATPDFTAYIKKYFYFGYENQRFLEIEHINATSDSIFRYVKSCPIPVEKNDKFTWGFDYKANVDLSNNVNIRVDIGAVLLYGSDGSFWVLGDDGGPSWKVSDSTFSTNFDTYGWDLNPSSIDMTQWNSFSIDAPLVPIDGLMYIVLFATPKTTLSQFQFDMCYSNLNFDYHGFIAGGYSKYTGQSFKTTRPGVYKATTKEQIYICNSPKRIYKGALLKKSNAGTFYLCLLFYDGQEYFYANDGENNLSSYGEQLVRAAHNQYRNGDETYQLTAQGLGGVSNPNVVHRIFNRDLEPNTNNKAFQLVTVEQDWKNCEWRATMIKNFDKTIGYIKDDVFEFKYIS